MICAHGVFRSEDIKGQVRSGVVLSDGLLLTAAEIERMETVPDLVFLSCCHLGKVSIHESGGNRLAASLAQELINMGVRCVVAAGWEVDDSAACCFSETFFNRLAIHGDHFAEAIACARLETLGQFPGCNTWGAYQAYGDPLFQLKLLPTSDANTNCLHAPLELIDWLEELRISAGTAGRPTSGAGFQQLCDQVQKRLHGLPESWKSQAEVQYGLGLLYSEWGDAEALEAARVALLEAVSSFTNRDNVPVIALEQLIDVEIRQAYSQACPAFNPSKPKPADFVAARRLITAAIERADRLNDVCQAGPNDLLSYRQVIRGLAYKRKAHIALIESTRHGKTKALDKLISKNLDAARMAYKAAEDEYASDWNPYAMLNRIQLEVMVPNTMPSIPDLCRCGAEAQVRYKQSFEVFDAVMKADVLLTSWLIGVTGGKVIGGSAVSTERDLIDSYDDALAGQRISPRQFESVVHQLQFIEDWLTWDKKTSEAQVLTKIIGVVEKRR